MLIGDNKPQEYKKIIEVLSENRLQYAPVFQHPIVSQSFYRVYSFKYRFLQDIHGYIGDTNGVAYAVFSDTPRPSYTWHPQGGRLMATGEVAMATCPWRHSVDRGSLNLVMW